VFLLPYCISAPCVLTLCSTFLFATSPGEERLFALGWKDNSYFFGDNETYMTFPTNSRERRLLDATMSTIRGRSLPWIDGAVAAKEEDIDEDDIDAVVRREGCQSEEDMFLARDMPASLLTLPSLLRGARGGSLLTKKWPRHELLEQSKYEREQDLRGMIAYILPDDDQPKWSCHGFGATKQSLLSEDAVDSSLFLDYLPALRRMAVLERMHEHVFRQKANEEQPPSRRTTRSSANATYQHYFDSISKALRLDMAALNSSQVGAHLAELLIQFPTP
jgi:hypothetical protein